MITLTRDTFELFGGRLKLVLEEIHLFLLEVADTSPLGNHGPPQAMHLPFEIGLALSESRSQNSMCCRSATALSRSDRVCAKQTSMTTRRREASGDATPTLPAEVAATSEFLDRRSGSGSPRQLRSTGFVDCDDGGGRLRSLWSCRDVPEMRFCSPLTQLEMTPAARDHSGAGRRARTETQHSRRQEFAVQVGLAPTSGQVSMFVRSRGSSGGFGAPLCKRPRHGGRLTKREPQRNWGLESRRQPWERLPKEVTPATLTLGEPSVEARSTVVDSLGDLSELLRTGEPGSDTERVDKSGEFVR
ncbi:hypothetical protein PC120_g19551 [Phytophthora cactorum]|nr:hypothetical protein PC120_g19551 [Phytophthora cactorum]